MAQVKAPKGTRDMLPQQSYGWHTLEETIRRICAAFCYREIRTPIFEHTELFLRGVGDTTDIVQKEMYTFLDKGERSITLRPEGTAGVVRAFIEHGLFNNAQPTKMYYLTAPVFRYENPQAGRLRQHHQFGVEVFGAQCASVDAEVISLALTLLSELGIGGLSLNINSIGCPACRGGYHEALKAYLQAHVQDLCVSCRERFDKNPLRILDCKEETCKRYAQDAPKMIDHLCSDCEAHFTSLKENLAALDIDYQVNPFIVRGLDYYTKTVFEIISDSIGAQGTVCGGGRYDGLIAQCGGPQMPGVGFGLGMERLLLVLKGQNGLGPEPPVCEVFICAGDADTSVAMQYLLQLRKRNIKAEMDHTGRSFKAQFKYADKIKAHYVMVMGPDELNRGKVKIKMMDTGEEMIADLYSAVTTLEKMIKG
jgi:histidyl-tRNA synthetase